MLVATQAARRAAGPAGTLQGSLLRHFLDDEAEVVGFDRDLCVFDWSSAVVRNTGVAREDAVGRSMLDLFPYIRGTPIETELRRTLDGDTTEKHDQAWAGDGMRGPRLYDMRYGPLYDDAGGGWSAGWCAPTT
jgi:hypothetical protein